MYKMIRVIGIFLLIGSLQLNGQTEKSDFLERWEHSEEYLLQFVELMPDSLYDYRPMEGMWSFDQQLHHIIQHLAWINHDFLMGKENQYQRPKYTRIPAAERIAELKTAFLEVRESVIALDETDLSIRYEFKPAGMTLRTIDLLYLMLDHTTHHRGQLVVYLRLKGLRPPGYIGW